MADLVEAYGQRALIGKVCMDCFTPDYYIESTEESLASTTEFVKEIIGRKVSTRIMTLIYNYIFTITFSVT